MQAKTRSNQYLNTRFGTNFAHVVKQFLLVSVRVSLESHLPCLELPALNKKSIPKQFDDLVVEKPNKVVLVGVLAKHFFE
jgi:hypothetical protein